MYLRILFHPTALDRQQIINVILCVNMVDHYFDMHVGAVAMLFVTVGKNVISSSCSIMIMVHGHQSCVIE